jgi:uncharacterized Zn finger protein (UPF0148 family)
MERCCQSCNSPFMRSKDGTIQFCVNCDDYPSCSAWDTASAVGWHNSDPNDPNGVATVVEHSPNGTIDQSTDEDAILEREIAQVQERLRSEARSSNVVSGPTVREVPATTARQETQSDRASKAISQLMLRNWALLGVECPNETCVGIPLLRNPQRRQEMFCVICEKTYTDPSTQNQSTQPSDTPQALQASSQVSQNTSQVSRITRTSSQVVNQPTHANVQTPPPSARTVPTMGQQNRDGQHAVVKHLALLTERLQAINAQMSAQFSIGLVTEARQIMESMEVAHRLLE